MNHDELASILRVMGYVSSDPIDRNFVNVLELRSVKGLVEIFDQDPIAPFTFFDNVKFLRDNAYSRSHISHLVGIVPDKGLYLHSTDFIPSSKQPLMNFDGSRVYYKKMSDIPDLPGYLETFHS